MKQAEKGKCLNALLLHVFLHPSVSAIHHHHIHHE